MPLEEDQHGKVGDEHEENPELIKENLVQLQEWLNTQKHLPEISEEMLRRFHHSCYNKVAPTKECIEKYFTLRSNSPEIFTERDVTEPSLAKSLNSIRLAVMPKTDARGYRIVCKTIHNPDHSYFVYKDHEKTMMMTLDAYMQRYDSDDGVVFILCMKGLTLRHLTKVSLSVLRKAVSYQQDANPIRMKEIHAVNVVSWIDKLMAFIKPVMKKELFDVMHFHSDMNSLYKFIPKEYLPEEFGGTQGSLDVLHEENTKHLASMREFFLEDEKKMRIQESKRDGKKKKNTEPAGGGLEID